MIPLEVDEVVAMGQHMRQATRKGEKFWSVFWKGGDPQEMNKDDRSPELIKLNQSPKEIFLASIWGMSFPWNLTLSVLLGIFLIVLPGLLSISIQTLPADICHLLGALVVVTAVIAMGEVLRMLRFLNVLFGLAVAAIPWAIDESTLALSFATTIAGLLILLLSFRRGPKHEVYGLWDKYIR